MTNVINFIVSRLSNLYISNAKEFYFHESYVYFHHKLNAKFLKYKKYSYNKPHQKTKDELNLDAQYIDNKYEKYLAILAPRLNEIHSVNFDLLFWKKALGLGFIRNLTLVYDAYNSYRGDFDCNIHCANILSRESYLIPSDFEAQRSLLADSDHGREQLFSLYCFKFYPNLFTEIKLSPYKINNNNNKIAFRKILRIFFERLFFLNKSQFGVLGCNFSKKNYLRLFFRSKFIFSKLDSLLELKSVGDSSVDLFARDFLSQVETDFDDFDDFFFFSIQYLFPKIYIEDFTLYLNNYRNIFIENNLLKIIFCENWISNSKMCLFLAVANLFRIRHFSIEHNCYYHQYAGSYISKVISLSDDYGSLGWTDQSYSNVIPLGSLFQFSIHGKVKTKEIDVLYIAACANVFMVHYSSAYGVDGGNALPHIRFCESFFDAMPKDVLARISYRAYPNTSNLLVYEKEKYLQNSLSGLKGYIEPKVSSKKHMIMSSLVIIDYVSTSYIESLVMNIPTVVLFNTSIYYLKDGYEDFYDDLISNGIFQTCPIKAANFVASIIDDPNAWWSSDEVQNARKNFLSKNFYGEESFYKQLDLILKAI
jgi:putative transferase (TIGR04331 family)